MSISLTGSARWAAVILAALVAGAASVKPVIGAVVAHQALRNGPWRTSLTTGAGGSIHERAAVALSGLYALAKEETIYFTAFTDLSGQKLDARCNYVLRGSPPAARWWSVTAYGADDFLIDNPARIYSRHAGNLAFERDGSFEITLAQDQAAINWLPVPRTGPFSITLRLYNPARPYYDAPKTAPLPQLVRDVCR